MAHDVTELIPVRTPIVKQSDDLVEVLLQGLEKSNATLEDKDVIVVASKVASIVEGRISSMAKTNVSREAYRLGAKLGVEPVLMQLIMNESESVIGGSPGFVLAVRKGFPCVNACIDAANAPRGNYILPPADADKSARQIRDKIKIRSGRTVAVVIADSGLLPGRKGTIGVALGSAGLKPARDYVGKKDLYGRTFQVTFQSVIDNLASAAKLLMGEADERIPFVIIRGAPVELTNETIDIQSTLLSPNVCVFMSSIKAKK